MSKNSISDRLVYLLPGQVATKKQVPSDVPFNPFDWFDTGSDVFHMPSGDPAEALAAQKASARFPSESKPFKTANPHRAQR
jgi:hypothetical protein